MPDNLNTPYLGQPGSSDNINTPFSPPTASEATVNVRSDISTVGDIYAQGAGDIGTALAVGTTLAVGGVTTLSDALASASAISGAAVTGTTGTFSGTVSMNSTNFASMLTQADFNDMTIGTWRAVFTSSGLSLGYSSGATLYDITSSTSVAQPTS